MHMLGKRIPFTIVTHCDFPSPELCKCFRKKKLSIFVFVPVAHLKKLKKTLFLMSVTILARSDEDVCLKIEGEPPDMTSNPFTMPSEKIKRPEICLINMTTQQISWTNVPRTTTLWDFEVSAMTQRTPQGKNISVPYQPRPFSGQWTSRYKETFSVLAKIPDDVHCIFVYDLPPSDQIQQVAMFAAEEAAETRTDTVLGNLNAQYEHSLVLWLSKDVSLLPALHDCNYGPTLAWSKAEEVFRYVWPDSNPFTDVTPMVTLDGLRLCLSTWFGSHYCGEAKGSINKSIKIQGLQNPEKYAVLTYHSSNIYDLSLPLTSGTIKFQLARSAEKWCIVIVAKLSSDNPLDAINSPFANDINHVSWLKTVISTTDKFDPSIIYHMAQATKNHLSPLLSVFASDLALKHIWNACIARGEEIWRVEMLQRHNDDIDAIRPPIEARRTHSQVPF